MTSNGNKLISDEGMTLTNGEAFGKTVWLAQEDSPGRWQEVTDEEAAILRRDNLEAEATDYEAALGDLGVSFDA